MPIYEYRVDETGEIIEIFQKMSDGHLSECPQTARRITRIISLPKVHVGPVTVDQLAHKNTQKMVRKKDSRIQAEVNSSNWWREEKKPDLELTKLSKKQKRNYIKTGRKNG